MTTGRLEDKRLGSASPLVAKQLGQTREKLARFVGVEHLDGVQLESARVKVAHRLELLANVVAKRHESVAHRLVEWLGSGEHSVFVKLGLARHRRKALAREKQQAHLLSWWSSSSSFNLFVPAERSAGRADSSTSLARLEPGAKFCIARRAAWRPARVKPFPDDHFAARQVASQTRQYLRANLGS
jgi:hypothetical protein